MIASVLAQLEGWTLSRPANAKPMPHSTARTTRRSSLHLVLVTVMLWGGTSFADDLAQLYEKAYFLETAKGQTEEALEIYRRIAATKPTDETRTVILNTMKRMDKLYRKDENLSFQQKIDSIDMENSNRDDLIVLFGEPERYSFDRKTYEKNNLPPYYAMVYSKNFTIWMNGNQIEEFRFEGSPVYEIGGISIGTKLNEVVDILGTPSKTLKGEECTYQEGVLYRDSPGRPKNHAYYSSKGLRLFFHNERVVALYMTDNTILKEK